MGGKKVLEESKKLNNRVRELLSKLSTDSISYTKEDYQKTARDIAGRSSSSRFTKKTNMSMP